MDHNKTRPVNKLPVYAGEARYGNRPRLPGVSPSTMQYARRPRGGVMSGMQPLAQSVDRAEHRIGMLEYQLDAKRTREREWLTHPRTKARRMISRFPVKPWTFVPRGEGNPVGLLP